MSNRNRLPGGSRLIPIPSVSDERGVLAFATGGVGIPFPVARVFWIYDVPETQHRGGHAHRTCAEVVFAVRGSFTMCVDDGTSRSEVCLSEPTEGILIPAGVWCELKDFEPGTVLVVLASHSYDAEGYINDYEEYRKQ